MRRSHYRDVKSFVYPKITREMKHLMKNKHKSASAAKLGDTKFAIAHYSLWAICKMYDYRVSVCVFLEGLVAKLLSIS